MNENVRRLLYWSPRVLCIAFAAFLALFAMDVFSEPFEFPRTLVALAMHLIPSAIVLVALGVVWRWEWVGAVIFPLLAAWHAVLTWGHLHWSGCAVIEGPLLLVGVLCWLSWQGRHVLRPLKS